MIGAVPLIWQSPLGWLEKEITTFRQDAEINTAGWTPSGTIEDWTDRWQLY